MARTTTEISMSLDGFVAGPDPTLEEPLGQGGEQLHEWVVRLRTWREAHGMEGGESDGDDAIFAESVEGTAAVVMGRKMFSGGSGPWEDDPNANGWWGEEPPFRSPVFVLTHHEREPLVLGETTFHFVTDGVGSALEQARAAAGDGRVNVAGGAETIQQALQAGLLEELLIHVAPVLLSGGARLFDHVDPRRLERTRVEESPAGAVHLWYRLS
jgi:dihydrofolate reductase